MAEATGISWCDATFNPWIGCEKVSPGCAHCYAEAWSERYDDAVWGESGTRRRTSTANWRKPFAWARSMPEKLGRRPRIFCASLADVFEPRPELDPWRRDLFALIGQTPELDWLLLTKRPEEARDWLHRWYDEHLFPAEMFAPPARWVSRDGIGWGVLPNVWIGTSIENGRHTWRADVLREIPAAVRFLSCEPLLGSLFEPPQRLTVGGRGHPRTTLVPSYWQPLDLDGIDWVIGGGESGGRTARPMHPAWVREIRDAIVWHGQVPCPEPWECGCEETPRDQRPAFHFKQWGSWGPPAAPGVRPGDLCWSLGPNGVRYAADRGYVCAPNESDGEWLRYHGASPTASGKRLDGAEFCEFPDPRRIPA